MGSLNFNVKPVPELVISNLSQAALNSNWQVVHMNNDVDSEGDPEEHNVAYIDSSDGSTVTSFGTNDTNSLFEGEFMLATDNRDVNIGTTTASWASFDINVGCQIVVWTDDNIVAGGLPTWYSTLGLVDNGHDIIIGQTTMSGYGAEFAPGTITLGGPGGTQGQGHKQYVVSIIPSNRRVQALGGQQGGGSEPGEIEFALSSYTGDDDAGNITFNVNRTVGTDGAASVTISVGSGGSHGTLNTTSVSWADGEGGAKSGTVTPNDVSGDQVMTLDLSGFTGAVEGNLSSTTINIIDADPAVGPAQEYYVNGTTGNNANDGLTPGNAWATLGKAGTAQKTASGHTVIWVETGTYNNDPFNQQNSGGDATNMIQYKPRNGDVTLTGNYNYFIRANGNEWWSIERDSGNEFIFDGNATPTKNGGHPGDTNHIALMDGQNNIKIAGTHLSSVGWGGIEMNAGNDNCVYELNLGHHGNPWDDANNDFGDTLIFRGPNSEWLFSGEFADDNEVFGGGHNLLRAQDGTGKFRHCKFVSEWSQVDGSYDANDGSRHMAIVEDATDFVIEDCIFRLAGQTVDRTNPGNDFVKLSGARPIFRWNIMLDATRSALQMWTNPAVVNSFGHRVAHNVFMTVGEDFLNMEKLNPTGNGGDSKFYNNIFVDTPTQYIWHVDWNTGQGNWITELEFRGNIIPAGSQINIFGNTTGGTPTPGLVTFNNQTDMDNFEAQYSNFSGNLVVSDPSTLLNSPGITAAKVSDFNTAYSNFTPSGAALNAGVALTQTNGSGSGSTTLVVDDANWFPDPQSDKTLFSNPTKGPDGNQGGYRIRNTTSGWTTTYTAVNKGTNTITLGTSQNWNDGDDINYHHTGSAPDIGAVQT